MTIQTRTPISEPIRDKLMAMVEDYIDFKTPAFEQLKALKQEIDGLFLAKINAQLPLTDQSVLRKHGHLHFKDYINYHEDSGFDGEQTTRSCSWYMPGQVPVFDSLSITHITKTSPIGSRIKKYVAMNDKYKEARGKARSPYWSIVSDAVLLEEVVALWPHAENLLKKVRKDLNKETSHYNKKWALRNPKEWQEHVADMQAVEPDADYWRTV